MEKRIGHRAVGKLAAAAAVGLAGFSAGQQADAALVIDIRATHVNGAPVTVADNGDGAETLLITDAPTTVTFQVVARVSGTDGLDNEGFQAIYGVFRSSTGGLLGDLTTNREAPFTGTGSQNGSQVDIDQDGDFDIGFAPNSNATATNPAFFYARSNIMETGGTRVGTDAEEFVIGTGTWASKAGGTGNETFLDFIRRRNPGNPGSNNPSYAGWNEDGSGTSSVRNGNSPYSVDGLTIQADVVPEPTSLALAGLAGIGLLGRRRNKN